MTAKMKVLLDTDIGSDIDDALALAYLLMQPRCELLGVTTVSGEAERRAEMASAVCRHAGRDDIPVHAGASQALLGELLQKKAVQASALGTWPRQQQFAPGTAVEFLRQTIRQHPGEVTLLTIGPLTNVALLFAADPEVPALLKQLVLMCGRFFGAKKGEWNAINDPHATAIVYGEGMQSRPQCHVSLGLDVTLRCVLPADECRRRFTARVLEPVSDFAEVWFQRVPHITFHDPLAAACVFEPDLCRYEAGLVRVGTSAPMAGWTVFTDPPSGMAPAHQCAREVEASRFFEHFFEVVR